jgi:hypothetical protein
MSERDEARRLLRELLGELSTNGHAESVPAVPAPPVAAVLRPSTWARPPAPGEVIGDGGPPAPADAAPRSPAPTPDLAAGAPPSPTAATPDSPAAGARPSPAAAAGGTADARVEHVSLATDAELDAFVRSLLARFENPRDRMAIRSGKLRFALRRAAASPQEAMRVERGAVTERTVKAAADAGTRLVLGARAVLTPLAREKARALGVEIERERRC